MADEIDLANGLIEGQISQALKRIRENSAHAKGTKLCIECGDEMPEARQELGFNRCISCASEAERRKSLFADE